MKKIIEYYEVEINLLGKHYSNKKGYTDKYLSLKNKIKKKRFKTQEEMNNYIDNFK
ncbi:MAG: hypothetical protein WC438_06105 [Candidatus Pacearchaeota archaeon]